MIWLLDIPAEVSRLGGVYDRACGVKPEGEWAEERSNSILRFGSDPYILLAECDSIRGTGLVGESKLGGK